MLTLLEGLFDYKKITNESPCKSLIIAVFLKAVRDICTIEHGKMDLLREEFIRAAGFLLVGYYENNIMISNSQDAHKFFNIINFLSKDEFSKTEIRKFLKNAIESSSGEHYDHTMFMLLVYLTGFQKTWKHNNTINDDDCVTYSGPLCCDIEVYLKNLTNSD